jgi:Beta protein
MVEVVKEKDRVNNPKSSTDIYTELFNGINSAKLLVDLPIYISPNLSTSEEVIKFFRSTISNLDRRIAFFKSFSPLSKKVIPVLSSLTPQTGETDTILTQFKALKDIFPMIAFRIFFKGFEMTFKEVTKIGPRAEDLLIYDLDTIPFTSPVVKKHRQELKTLKNFCAVIRSAINTEIQNTKLDPGEVIGEADNSLLEFYKEGRDRFDAFGDFVGIKKDEMTAGGTISPGFIFYDPLDNLYYGYKGKVKMLSEFEDTIVPEVLASKMVAAMKKTHPSYLTKNEGFETLLRIKSGKESGKSQAKFKKISMEHYLHCLWTKANEGDL